MDVKGLTLKALIQSFTHKKKANLKFRKNWGKIPTAGAWNINMAKSSVSTQPRCRTEPSSSCGRKKTDRQK